MDMVGKILVITGASRGIGAATAREFAACGANVALVARSTDEIVVIAGEISAKALAISCNVSGHAEVEAAVNTTAQTFGELDILINKAGIVDTIGDLADADPDAWGGAIAQGHATIINVSSGAAHGSVEG